MLRHLSLITLIASILQASSSLSFGSNSSSSRKFESKPVQIDDRFMEDSRDKYRLEGEVVWSQGKLELPPNASMSIVQTMGSEFEYKIDLKSKEIGEEYQSRSMIHIYLSNRYRLVLTVYRAMHDGQLVQQVTMTQVDGRDLSRKEPGVTELFKSPVFAVLNEVESWGIQYRHGILQLSVNGSRLGRTYSAAFTSWVHAIAFAQTSNPVEVLRIQLDAKTAGYSEEQQRIYRQINSLRQQAAEAEKRGDLEKAVELELDVLPVVKGGFDRDEAISGLAHQKAALRLQTLGKLEQAKFQFDECSKLFRRVLGDDHPETLQNEMYCAEQIGLSGDFERAANEMRSAYANYSMLVGSSSKDTKTLGLRLAAVLERHADDVLARGLYSSAISEFKEIHELYKTIHGTDHWMTSLAWSDVEFAERIANADGAELSAMKEYLATEREFHNQGFVASAVSFDAKRERQLVLARQIFGNDSHQVANLLSAVATDRFNQGRMDEALKLLEEATEVYKVVGGESSPNYISSLGSLGSFYSMTQRYTEASQLLTQSCRLMKEQSLENSEQYAYLQLGLGRHLIRIGKNDDAIKPLRTAFELYRSLGQQANPNSLKACERLASLCRAKGDLEGSESYTAYQREVVLSSFGNDSEEMLDVLVSESSDLLVREQFDDAIEKGEKAIRLAERSYGKTGRGYEAAIRNIIDIHLARGDMPSAINRFEEILDFELNRRERLFGVYSRQQQFDRSLRDLPSLDSLIILALEGHLEPERAYNHALAFKGAVTAWQRSNQIIARTPELRNAATELAKIENQLDMLRDQVKTTSLIQKHDELTLTRNRMKSLLVERSNDYRIVSARTKTADLKRTLPDNTVLIDYFEYQMPKGFFEEMFSSRAKIGLVAFVVSNKTDVRLIDLGPIDPIIKTWARWLSAMNVEAFRKIDSSGIPSAELTDRYGTAVREKIWDPIEKHLNDVKTVVVSPSDHLSACPFPALPAREEGAFFIEKYAFATVTTPRLLPDLIRQRKRTRTTKLLLVGDIDYGSPKLRQRSVDPVSNADESSGFFTYLPTAKQELDRVRDVFQECFKDNHIVELRDEHASERNVRRESNGARYIHFCTHGFSVPNGARFRSQAEARPTDADDSSHQVTGISLSNANHLFAVGERSETDGVLLTDEIVKLDLTETEMVTLSACQTALGELVPGEGMLSAQRALHVAGAGASLTTIWSVSDQSTVDLMSKFYELLWNHKLSKAEAMQGAMIHMLRHYDGLPNSKPEQQTDVRQRTPPVIWAAFVLHGDWR